MQASNADIAWTTIWCKVAVAKFKKKLINKNNNTPENMSQCVCYGDENT